MEEFFNQGTLPEEHMIEGLREATAKDKLFPILCGSASLNIGTDLLLNFLVDYFPSAIQHDPVHATAGDQRVDRTIADQRIRSPLSCSKLWLTHLRAASLTSRSTPAC